MSLRAIGAIAKNTYRESARGKLIYATVISAILLVCIAMCFGMVTIGDPVKMAKDFGLFSMSISVVAFVVISGSSHLHKELTRKTIYNILSKSVDRWEFVLGKYFGMLATSAVMILVMGLFLSTVMWVVESTFDRLLLLSYLYIFFEVVIVCALATMFSSSVVTPALAGLLTFGVFLAGRSVDYLMYFVEKGEVPAVLRSVFVVLHWILPNFSELAISDHVVHEIAIPVTHTVFSALYTISYSAIIIALACGFFRKREFL